LKQEILEKGSAHEDFTLNILDAADRSKDPDFINFVSKLRDNWESAEILDETDSDEVIIDKMTTKWNNIVARKGNDAKKDPPDAKITALSSEISSLKNQIVAMQKGGGSNGGGSNGSGSATKSFIPDWRKTKTLGETVDRDDKTWHWCPHHMDGKGLYVTHKPDGHDEWLENKKNNRRGKREKETPGAQPPASTSNLVLSDRMKTALATRGFNENQASEIMKEVNTEGTDFW